MFNKSFFNFLLYSFLVSYSFSVPTSRSIFNFTSPLQNGILNNFNEKNEKSNFFQQLLRNNSNNRTQHNISFWTVSDMNKTLEPDSQPKTETETQLSLETEIANGNYENTDTLNDTTNENCFMNPIKTSQINEENKNDEVLFNASDVISSAIDEKIVLRRYNCNLEIPVQENRDLKIEIEFQKLKNNTSGKCCITLKGEIGSLLGIVISNIHLYRNSKHGEVIRVIIADGTNFVIKEYYSWSKYQPLLMTETHKVYIVLHYDVKIVPLNEQNSHFNLEVFSYHKYENSINDENSHHQPYFSNYDGLKNLLEPSFFSYFYK